jgi:drug/metabolite transporter (DMT)-like permease
MPHLENGLTENHADSEGLPLVYFKLILTAFLWGGTFIAGKMIAHSVQPVCAAFLRFAIATLFLLMLTVRIHGRIPALGRRQILPVLLLGLTGVFAYNILFLTGLKYIHAGRAALIVATNPACCRRSFSRNG